LGNYVRGSICHEFLGDLLDWFLGLGVADTFGEQQEAKNFLEKKFGGLFDFLE
jgi:hypothetical protein